VANNGNMIDCILVGPNDYDLDWVDTLLKPMNDVNGAYRHWQSNTVIYKGKRRHYTGILNKVLEDVSEKSSNIHVAETPNLACCILKSFLSNRGYRAEIVNFYNNEKDRFIDLLKSSPKSIAITTTLYTNPRPIIEIVELIRLHNPGVKIIVGGPYIFNTCADVSVKGQDGVFKQIKADIYVNDSQGESTLSRIIDELNREKPDLTNVPNIIFTEDHKTFERTRRETESNDINQNTVNWKIFDKDYLIPTVWMRTSLGCSFRCSFCRYPLLGGSLTLQDPEAVEEQLKFLDSLGVSFVNFVDDTFNVPNSRFKKFCKTLIQNKFKFKWISYFRGAEADAETIDLMKESGCFGVFVGCESGDQQVLNNMNKKANITKMTSNMKSLKKNGILVYASFIIGFPGENKDSIKRTYDFIEDTAPDYYSAESFLNDPKAPINSKKDLFNLKGVGYGWQHNSMDWREAHEHVEWIHKNVNSTYLPFYGGDIWCIPHFITKGFTADVLKNFFKVCHRMVVKGLESETPDYADDSLELEALLQNHKIQEVRK
jgi:radical SAM PhpK family P-methyltransferase